MSAAAIEYWAAAQAAVTECADQNARLHSRSGKRVGHTCLRATHRDDALTAGARPAGAAHSSSDLASTPGVSPSRPGARPVTESGPRTGHLGMAPRSLESAVSAPDSTSSRRTGRAAELAVSHYSRVMPPLCPVVVLRTTFHRPMAWPGIQLPAQEVVNAL